MPPTKPTQKSAAPTQRPRQDWLSRALARAGVLPQREAEEAIQEGRVRVDGQVMKQPFYVPRRGDKITVDGKRVNLSSETFVLLFHKPEGSVTSMADKEGFSTVFELLQLSLPEDLRSYTWHAVGRLDRQTTGLLLFTNDEKVVTHVTSPSTKLEKRYVAKVSGKITRDKTVKMVEGVELEDGIAQATSCTRRGDSEIVVTLTEGRNHQVKRMLGKVGLPVLALHREAIGKIDLEGVEMNAHRLLTPDEVKKKLGFPPEERASKRRRG